jgi:hypothetical protein
MRTTVTSAVRYFIASISPLAKYWRLHAIAQMLEASEIKFAADGEGANFVKEIQSMVDGRSSTGRWLVGDITHEFKVVISSSAEVSKITLDILDALGDDCAVFYMGEANEEDNIS